LLFIKYLKLMQFIVKGYKFCRLNRNGLRAFAITVFRANRSCLQVNNISHKNIPSLDLVDFQIWMQNYAKINIEKLPVKTKFWTKFLHSVHHRVLFNIFTNDFSFFVSTTCRPTNSYRILHLHIFFITRQNSCKESERVGEWERGRKKER